MFSSLGGGLPGLDFHRGVTHTYADNRTIFLCMYNVNKYINIYVWNYKELGSMGAFFYVAGRAFSTLCCASLFTYLYSEKGSGEGD